MERMDRLETQLHESREETWDRSRERWRGADPTKNLTWGVEVPGKPFIDKVAERGGFGEGKTIVEIGPGYGRLLAAALESGVPFGRWLGVDLSSANVAHLRERFDDPRVEFVNDDAETVELPEQADTLISSLTFKHMFPSFEGPLANLARQLREGGQAMIDLIEGERRYFEPDGVTYIRWYSREEVEEILVRCGLEPAGFDEVRHLPTITRLLFIARKP